MNPDDDWLHKLLRHTIRVCYGDDPQHPNDIMKLIGFRGIEIDKDVPPEFYAEGVWPCYASAARLCKLLTGDDLSGDGQRKGMLVPLADEKRRIRELDQMKLSPRYLLVRISVLGDGSGHAYIFLSTDRKSGQDIHGFLYQTNIGCDAMFDLAEWIGDAKSKQEVELGAYFQNLLSGFQSDAVKAYEENYMLGGTTVADSQRLKLQTNPVKFEFAWKPVDDHKAMIRLAEFLKANRRHPPVAALPKVKLTSN